MTREQAAQVAKETKTICENKGYYSNEGSYVDLAYYIDFAQRRTKSFPFTGYEGTHPRLSSLVRFEPTYDSRVTKFNVVNTTSLDAAKRFYDFGYRVTILNFASAKKPGGGWLSGAMAQEESLARSSALVFCLEGDPMYTYHRLHRDPLYTSWLIKSPSVPVFRDSKGLLLDKVWTCDIVTCAAPNLSETKRPFNYKRIKDLLKERMLRICMATTTSTVVFGAWGCGVFKNDPTLVAEAFHEILTGPFLNRFEEVTFAVLDDTKDKGTITPFVRRFTV